MANIIVDGIERMKVSQPNERTYTQEEVDAIEKKAFKRGLSHTSKYKDIDDLYKNLKTIILNNKL